MNKNISTDEAAELLEIFNMFDKNGDERLDLKEIGAVLRYLGQNPTQKDLDKLMEEADKDGSHAVDFGEYCQLIASHRKHPDDERMELIQAFQYFDKDKSGDLDKTEMRKVLLTRGDYFTEQDVNELISLADANGDGKIQVEELVDFLMCTGEKRISKSVANYKQQRLQSKGDTQCQQQVID